MLLCFLSVSALLLGGLAVLAEDIDTGPYCVPPFSANGSYTANLTSAACAFASGDCVEGSPTSSFLTIRFTLSNASLLANSITIFPPTLPMHFEAERHWWLDSRSRSGSETVTVAYEIDTQSIPQSHQLGAVPDNSSIYRLKLSLFDLQGRPATERPVYMFVRLVPSRARPGDGSGKTETGNGTASGTLEVIQVEEAAHLVYHHHLHISQNRDPDGKWSWWRADGWKSYSISHNREPSMTETQTETEPGVEAEAQRETSPSHRPHSDPTAEISGKEQGLTDWIGNRHSWRLAKPVLIPGFFELAIAVLSSVLGYLMGKAIVAVHEYFCERSSAFSKSPDLESHAEDAVFSGSDDEKRRLMAMYPSESA
ncbi:hypothetical protein BDW75DRAFT_221290 [Aspergillus navahoensis]